MKKRFSKDLLGKERHVWIEPRTKSIHWYVLLLFFAAHLLFVSVFCLQLISPHSFCLCFLCRAKNAHDRQANVKVKYFLLDKNNPSLYIGTDRPMSSSSTATTATAASVPTTRADANSNSNSSAAENIDTADTTSSNTVEGAPATALLTGAAVLNGVESNTNKAQGQLVGIIHSATINHLSIRIQTESGDYLNLTVSRDLVEFACVVRDLGSLTSLADPLSTKLILCYFYFANRFIPVKVPPNVPKIGLKSSKHSPETYLLYKNSQNRALFAP